MDCNPDSFITDKDRKTNVYNNFVKSEKQFGEDSKTRCICSPNGYYKYIMGPVTLELERVLTSRFFGYGAPKNWADLEDYLDETESLGLIKTTQLDGSGFDLTQHVELKRIVDFQIYQYLANKNLITHVDKDDFLAVAKAERRIINLKNVKNNHIVSYGQVEITGKTFSGSCDTTLMNTLRMALYNRFVMEHHMKCRPDVDYRLLTKGDDVVNFHNQDFSNVIKNYNYVFTPIDAYKRKNDIINGLGQIAKFYKNGGFVNVDFCSINVIETI